MAVVYRRCAGLDIHRDKIAACIRIHVNGKYEERHEVFGGFRAQLQELARWLRDHRVRHVAMESTGVYWIPVWNVLEEYRYRFNLLLVNPAQVRAMNGHKTDKIDCARIAEFLQHGRLAGSYIPAPEIREARALSRRRVHLQQDRNRVTNRIGRLLQTANIKLSSVLSNIVGVSGERMLRSIAAGEQVRKKLAELAHYSLEGKKAAIESSLEGLSVSAERTADRPRPLRRAAGQHEYVPGAVYGAPSGSGRATVHDSGHRQDRGVDNHRRDRLRCQRLSGREASGQLGGGLSGQQ